MSLSRRNGPPINPYDDEERARQWGWRPPSAKEEEAFERKRRAALQQLQEYLAARAAAAAPAEPPLPVAPATVPGTPPPAPTLAPSANPTSGEPAQAGLAAPPPGARLRRQGQGAARRTKPRKRRDPFRNVTLLGETWERFPKGGLPLGLLKEVVWALEASVQFRRETDLGPHYVWPEDSTLLWHLSATARHDQRALKQMSAYDLEVLVGQDMERLVRTCLLPKHAEHELRRDAVLGALVRVGQVYQYCRRKWKQERAREVVWGAVQRVCQAPKRAYQMLEQGKAVEALWKARAAEQQAAQAQALALLGDYVI